LAFGSGDAVEFATETEIARVAASTADNMSLLLTYMPPASAGRSSRIGDLDHRSITA
jgi:hypothetical protein